MPITSLSLAGSNQANSPLATSLLYSQSNTQSAPNTNIAQVSSFAPPVNSYTYHSITPNTPASTPNPWIQDLSLIPGDVASTVGGLVNWALTPYGFTPGGAPLAGGQFPNNYPFTQEGINP